MNNGHGGLPFGFKFKPKNSELIWYLLHKVNGSPLYGDHFIIDCDLYDGKDSWKRIFDSSPAGTTRLYFFTKLKKMTEKGTPTGGNNNRRTGSGTWKETQNCGTVYDPNSNPKKPIGNKRSFKFAPNRNVAAEFTGRWLMDEFSLDSRFVCQNMDEYVVCCIKREEDRKSKLRCPNTVHLIRNSEQEDCRNSGSANSINDTTTATTLDSENGAMNIGDPNLCFTQDDLPALFDPNLCFTQDDLPALFDPNLCFNPEELLADLDQISTAPECQLATTLDGPGFTDSNSSKYTGRLLMDTPFVPKNMDEYVVCCIKREEDRKSKLHCPNTFQLIRNSEQEDCRNSGSANSINDTTTATTLDSENGAMNIGDPNLCFTQDDLPALFDPNLCFTQDDLSALFDPNLCINPELLADLDQISTAPECQLAKTLDGPGFTDSNSSTYTSRLLMDTPFAPNQSFQEKTATSLR